MMTFARSVFIISILSMGLSACLKTKSSETSETHDRTAQGLSAFGDRRVFIWTAAPRDRSNQLCWYKTLASADLTAPFEKLVRALPKVPLSGIDGLKPPEQYGSFLASGGPVSFSDFETAIKTEAGSAASLAIAVTLASGIKSCVTAMLPVPVAVKVWSGSFCVVELGATGALIYNRKAKIETSGQVIVQGDSYKSLNEEHFSILNRGIAALRLKTFESMHSKTVYNATYSKEYIDHKNLCYAPDEIIR